MFRTRLKTAFRYLARHRGFSLINIGGLTLGLTTCLLIGLFVRDERQFDTFLPEGDRIYRIYNERTNHEGTEKVAGTPPMFNTILKQSFPEVEQTVRIMKLQSKDLFEAGDHTIYEAGGIAPDSTFFQVFPLPFIHGTAAKALDEPASIVLSEEMAARYFGQENPVGKEIQRNGKAFQVKGVFRTHPKFHLPITYIIPLSATGVSRERMESWGWQQFYSYVKVKKGADIAQVQTKFRAYIRQKVDPITQEGGMTYLPFFQPLHRIHLYSADFKFDLLAIRGNITYVNALTIIAVFILLIACFNFVNLAIAQSLQRAREVGVRKAIGASRQQLMGQYMTETVLLTFISIILAVGLTFLTLPWLNRFTEKHIVFDLFTNPLLLLTLLVLTFGVGVLAGFYPALVLSGFQPVKVLKGTLVGDATPGRVPWLRNGLVVVQFALSVLLIISAIVVLRQVDYLHNKDLGLNKDQIMFFPMRGEPMFANHQTFKNELLRSPGVASVSIGYGFPGDMFAGDQIIVPKAGEQTSRHATHLLVDFDYIKTLGLQMVAGRDFSEKMKTDPDQAFIINETAVKELGLGTPEKALGKTLHWPTWQHPDSVKKGQIIGVVKDFNYKSLYDKVETAVIHIYPDAYWKVAVKMKSVDIGSTVRDVQSVWNKFSPDYPIEYTFLDENFKQMYQAEDKLKSLLGLFTALTVFVACLGLFGLAAYMAERRRKEIGIRKVLGASVQGIVVLLSKDFIKLVIISLLIASPVAWYFMHQWLEGFAYRIEMNLWIVALAGLLAVVIALVTVSFQAIKAGRSNPVKSLRTE